VSRNISFSSRNISTAEDLPWLAPLKTIFNFLVKQKSSLLFSTAITTSPDIDYPISLAIYIAFGNVFYS
jgi:hypothetical protein